MRPSCLAVAILATVLCQALGAQPLSQAEAYRHSVAEARETAAQSLFAGRTLAESRLAGKQLELAAEAARAKHDHCAGHPTDRVVVGAVPADALGFVGDMGLPFVGYQHKNPLRPYFYPNVANEAGAYVQYILDHWDCLPQAMAFIHGHEEETWHSASMHWILPNLRWDLDGYHDINRRPTPWEIPIAKLSSSPYGSVIASGTDVFNGSFDPHQVHRGLAYDSWEIGRWLQHGAMSRAWDMFYGRFFGAAPEEVMYTCCAQFVVSRNRVQARGKAFFEAQKAYLISNDLRPTPHHSLAYLNGDVTSVYWFLMFSPIGLEKGNFSHYQPLPECQVFHCRT